MTTLHDSPILSFAMLGSKYMLTSSMSGQLSLHDVTGQTLDRRRDHQKYVVEVVVHQTTDPTCTWVATAGWDAKVHLYRIDMSQTTLKLPEPAATIELTTNPEGLAFVQHPETAQLILIITRRDSTFLYYHAVDDSARLLGKQNLAPHSNAWIAFTPSAIALCPTDDTLLAVATSAVPHMKLIIVRLMLPEPIDSPSATTPAPPLASTTTISSSLLDASEPGRQHAAAAARAALALQDREAAAIQIHATTLAPQTAYSTPALAWRPDGSGVWVNSDDGVIRGIEASSGKIVMTLKGHEPGSKVRCLCTLEVERRVADGGPDEVGEWLVSGGFDQRLIVWRPEMAS